MENLEQKLCEMVIKRCKLTDISVDDIDFDAPLFASDDEADTANSLELDSVDALEIVSGVKSEFGVTISVKDMSVFRSINTLAKYIKQHIE